MFEVAHTTPPTVSVKEMFNLRANASCIAETLILEKYSLDGRRCFGAKWLKSTLKYVCCFALRNHIHYNHLRTMLRWQLLQGDRNYLPFSYVSEMASCRLANGFGLPALGGMVRETDSGEGPLIRQLLGLAGLMEKAGY